MSTASGIRSTAASAADARLHAAQSHVDDEDFDFQITRAEFRRSLQKMAPTVTKDGDNDDDDAAYDFEQFMQITSSKHHVEVCDGFFFFFWGTDWNEVRLAQYNAVEPS